MTNCCQTSRYGILNLYDVTSTLRVREHKFAEVKKIIEDKLQNSSEYLENFRKKKYNQFVLQNSIDEHHKKEILSFEDWKLNLLAKKLDYDLYLPSSSFFEISETYFYNNACKFSFEQSNLLYKFYFEQFGKTHDDKIYDHNIILINLVSLCSDANKDKVSIFYQIISQMGIVTVKNFIDYLKMYLENNIFGVLKKINDLTQDEENKYHLVTFLNENESDLKNEISCFINDVSGMYHLKDQNEEKIYLVEESDCEVIFKNREFIFNFEELWKYFLEKAELKKRNY